MWRWFISIAFLLATIVAPSISFAVPATVDTSSSAQAIANSAQRKTFFDTENEVHWAFYYNGTAIEYSYSADGVAWTSAGTLAYNTASFSVVFKAIGGTSYAFLVAEANTHDIVLRRGELDATSVTFDAEQVVFDGTGAANRYAKATVAISENNHLWVSSIKDFGLGVVERYQVQVRRSTNSANGNLAVLNASTVVGRGVGSLKDAIIMSRNGDEMFLISSADETNVVGYTFDGSEWSSANTGGDYSWFSFGSSGLNGSARAIVIIGSDVYVGGSFADAAGISTADGIARWDGSSWNAVGGGVSGSVYAMAVSGTDIFVGGFFNDAGNIAEADNIARWDGTSWSALGSGVGSAVYAIAISGANVYVGGQFVDGGGLAAADKIARWDGTNWNALATGLSDVVYAIAISGADVYVGGNFLNAGTANGDRIARWNGASWNALSTGLSSAVYAITISGADVYVGGNFINAGSANGDRIVRWNGAAWNALGTGLPNVVYSIAINGTDIYAGGNFADAGGVVAADNIARWNGATWNALDSGLNDSVRVMAFSGSDIFFGGDFSNAGGHDSADGITRWDGSAWNPLDSGGLGGAVHAIAIGGTEVYVGGLFTTAGGVAGTQYIARWDGTRWHALGTGVSEAVFVIEVAGSDVYVGGNFNDAGGVAGADWVARWDGNQWHALGSGTNGGSVVAIAVSGSDVYVGGYFSDASGVANTERIARWDGSNWNAVGTGIFGIVDTIVVSGSDVYVGGLFEDVGGILEADYIVRWDVDDQQWNALGSGLSSVVSDIAIEGSNLYAGGSFENAGGIADADYIARWDGANWHAVGAGLNAATVYAIGIINTEIYVGGFFSDVAGIAEADGIAKWDGTSWSAVGISATSVNAIGVLGSEIFVGGSKIQSGSGSVPSNFNYYAPAIARDADASSEISATSDANGNIYLNYTNEDDEVRFRRFDHDDASWGATVTLNATPSSSPATSFRSASGGVTASWIESNAVAFRHGLAPYAGANWSSEQTFYATGTNRSISSTASQETTNLPLMWTNGAANPYSIYSDGIAMTAVPTVTISAGESDPTKNSPIEVTFTFSEVVTGFVAGDITVGNGTAGNFVAVDGDTYTADITPTADGQVTVDIAAGVAENIFGNDNTAATQFAITYDATAPTVTISSTAPNSTRSSPIPVTIEFSETISDFVLGDILVANGTAGAFVAVDGNTYTANITPTAEGAVTVNVNAAVAEDAAENDNAAAVEPLVITYDSISPTIVISSSASNPTPISPIPVAFEFSENVIGFSAGDVVVSNGVLNNFVAEDGSSYTAVISPSADGMISVAVLAAVAEDAAGNPNIAAATLTRLYQSPDSDGDTLSDATELNDGTNPDDPGSFLAVLPTQWCSEWNGYFGMLNVNEYMNSSEDQRNIIATLFDIDGIGQSSYGFSVDGSSQNDYLVHAMQGWVGNSYGKVCSEITNGAAGDVDGRMVYYKANEAGYDFAFALPYYAGLTGRQFVTFNNMQPSQDPADAENLVGNWVQITNLASSEKLGTLIFYDQDGEVLTSEAITLPPETRRDYSAHQFGAEFAGLIEWRPESSTAKFVLRNTRYYYDNPEMKESFDGGLQLEGMKGNGEQLRTVLDTRQQLVVLEIANTTEDPLEIEVMLYNSAGELVGTELLDDLDGYNSRHIIVNEKLDEGLGSATIDGSAMGSVMAVAMHYGKTAQASTFAIKYGYGVVARETLGTTVRGSYNTWLGQGCELQLVNSAESSVETLVEMKRLDGTEVLSNHSITTPINGTSSFDLCSVEEADQYGVVTVTSAKNSVTPLILRRGANSDYRFATPVR